MKKGLLLLVLAIVVGGCRTKTVYLPVETVKTEYRDKFFKDSVYMYDSVFVKLKGDTVWLEKYKYQYRDKLVKDSVFINDTIRIAYPVVETKEVNRLHTWQILLMCMGAVLIGLGGYKIFSFFKR